MANISGAVRRSFYLSFVALVLSLAVPSLVSGGESSAGTATESVKRMDGVLLAKHASASAASWSTDSRKTESSSPEESNHLAVPL